MVDDERRQRDYEQRPAGNKISEIDAPPEKAITSEQTLAASSLAGYRIEFPSTYIVGTTTTMTVGDPPIFSAALIAQPVDPIATVEYESGMFFETVDLALNHWNEYPNVVVRHAIVEDAVLHARSLCEVILDQPQNDDNTISLRRLIPGYDETKEKFKTLRNARGQLSKEYKGNRRPTYEKLFNTRVIHPTDLRGGYGLYEEPLRCLKPKILAVVREIAALTGYRFRLPPDPE